MLEDIYKDATAEQLKAVCVIKDIMLDISADTVVTLSDEPNAELSVRTVKQSYGTYSWTSTFTRIIYSIPPTWYSDIYLKGLGSVKYNGKITLALSAEEQPLSLLKPELRHGHIALYKVKLPIYTPHVWLPHGHSTPPKMDVEERFMAVAAITNGSMAFAGKTPGIAAGNLNRSLMKLMKESMRL